MKPRIYVDLSFRDMWATDEPQTLFGATVVSRLHGMPISSFRCASPEQFEDHITILRVNRPGGSFLEQIARYGSMFDLWGRTPL